MNHTGTQLTIEAIHSLDASEDEKLGLLEILSTEGLHGPEGNEDDVTSPEEARVLVENRLAWARTFRF